MTRDIGKIVGLAASGMAPEWDLMVVTDAHHGSLWTRKLHLPFDYQTLGVDESATQYDGGTVSIANQMILPAYNKNLCPLRTFRKNGKTFFGRIPCRCSQRRNSSQYGHLFAAFLTTPEAQEILDKHLGLSSVHVKGTRAHKFAQGRELVFMKQDKAQLVDKLSREYGKILGFD